MEAEAEAEAGPDAAAWDEADEEESGGGDRAEGGRELMSGIAGSRVIEWLIAKEGHSCWF